MNVVKHDHHFKLIFMGPASAGKTCLIQTLNNDYFDPNTMITCGVDIVIKTVDVDGSKISMQIWDTNGGLLRTGLLKSYFIGVQGVIMVYDVTNSHSFTALNEFLEEIENYGPDGFSKLIVGTKCDLNDKRQVDFASAKKFADEHGIPIMEASAKSKIKVNEIFSTFARQILGEIRV